MQMTDNPGGHGPRDYAKRTKRGAAYFAIDTERSYQDAKMGNSARENVDDNRDLGSLLTLIDVYLGKTKTAFAGPHPDGKLKALHELRKTAALCVLAMELHGAPARL